MNPPEKEITDATIGGIKYATLLFAFVGSVVSLSYAKPMTRGQMAIAVFVGVAVAVASTPLLLHYLGLAAEMERAISFFSGLAAMRAVPAGLALIDKIRDIKLPWTGD